MENERKELTVVRDQNSKLLVQLQDGADRELLLKQKSSALNTSITNLQKDLKDVSIFFCKFIELIYLSILKINV